MAKVEHIQGDAPNDPFAEPLKREGFNHRRGKVLPPALPSWGGDRERHNEALERGRNILDEAER